MACFERASPASKAKSMACFEGASPALRQILLRLYSAEKPLVIDHHIYEFGSVKYHIQSSASDQHSIYLSIATPLLSQEAVISQVLSASTIQLVKEVCSDVVDTVEPAEDGYQLTLRLNFSRVPQGKDSVKIITKISTVQATILSSQLKEILCNVSSKDTLHGMHKAIKLVYHPREPFFVIRQPDKITAVFPMRFKEKTDVVLATAFFQELTDVGNTKAWAKAPPCTWSPIPPPELRGETFEDLSTNGGFVAFDIFSRHTKGRALNKTVWNLLNFYAYVKNLIKSNRGYIQRRMRMRMESLAQVLQKATIEEGGEHSEKPKGCRCVRKFINLSKSRILKRRCKVLAGNINKTHSPSKVYEFGGFRQRYLTIPKFSSQKKHSKLD